MARKYKSRAGADKVLAMRRLRGKNVYNKFEIMCKCTKVG